MSRNRAAYAGSSNWKLLAIGDLATLYADISLPSGDTRLELQAFTGPFRGLQPGFYWACERDSNTTSNRATCDLAVHPGFAPGGNTPMQFSFNFDDGFLGTDKVDKHFYVLPYSPAAPVP